MTLFRIACLLGVVALLTGCATPSIHPLHSADKAVLDPGIVGTWQPKDDQDTTYTVTRSDDGYLLRITSIDDEKKREEWTFDVKLVQLGKHRFADFAARQEDRSTIDDRFGPLFVPTHLFVKLVVEGDALSAWLLSRSWLEKTLADGKVPLAHTRISDHELLITADTAQLQAFLQAHADDPVAFSDKTELRRVKP